MDNQESIRLGFKETCTPEEGQKKKSENRAERQRERARRYRETYCGGGYAWNNTVESNSVGSNNSRLNGYGYFPYIQPVHIPLNIPGFYIPVATIHPQYRYFNCPGIIPQDNTIGITNGKLGLKEYVPYVCSVDESGPNFTNQPTEVANNLHFVPRYDFFPQRCEVQPPFQIPRLYIPAVVVQQQPIYFFYPKQITPEHFHTRENMGIPASNMWNIVQNKIAAEMADEVNKTMELETDVFYTTGTYVTHAEEYTPKAVDQKVEDFVHERVNRSLSDGMPKTTFDVVEHVDGRIIHGTRCKQDNTIVGVEVKPKKKKKRNRSAKQIERARRYKERKYGCGNTLNNENVQVSDSNLLNSSGKLSYKQPAQPTIHILSLDIPGAIIHHIFCTELLNPEKYVNSENIKALILNECSKVPDESDAGTNNASVETNKSVDREVNFVVTTGKFATVAEQYVKWSEGDIAINKTSGTGDKHKKEKKRKLSTKKIERARKWREQNYGCGYNWNNTDQVGSNRSILTKYGNKPCGTPEVVEKWINTQLNEPNPTLADQIDIKVRRERRSEKESIERKQNSKLRSMGDEFIPFIENQISPQEENNLPKDGNHSGNNTSESDSDTVESIPVLPSEYDDNGMYEILAIYMNSGLQGEFDSTVESDEKTITDGEDFGYEYFSLSNLCNV